MQSRSQVAQLRRLAAKISVLRPTNEKEAAMLGLLTGAVYGLLEAKRLGYRDRIGAYSFSSYALQVSSVAQQLSNGSVLIKSDWNSEYHFNSALHRISALNDRIDKYMEAKRDLAASVRREVNRQKHDVDGLIRGRQVKMKDAIESVIALADALGTVI